MRRHQQPSGSAAGRAEAVAECHRCRSTLAAKLDIAPSPESEAVHQALRAP